MTKKFKLGSTGCLFELLKLVFELNRWVEDWIVFLTAVLNRMFLDEQNIAKLFGSGRRGMQQRKRGRLVFKSSSFSFCVILSKMQHSRPLDRISLLADCIKIQRHNPLTMQQQMLQLSLYIIPITILPK